MAFTVVIVGMVVFAAAASADTVTGQGTLSGDRYRGGVPSAGGINFAAGVQVNRDPTGRITHVRGAARITKLTNVTGVQVDSVALGTSTIAVIANNTPAVRSIRPSGRATAAGLPLQAGHRPAVPAHGRVRARAFS